MTVLDERENKSTKPPFEESVLNDLYAASLQFGNNWRKPIIRLTEELYPHMPPKEQKELADYIEDVRRTIEEYVYNGYYNKYKNDTETLQKITTLFIEKEYSWMNSHNIGHAISQGIYYAWRG